MADEASLERLILDSSKFAELSSTLDAFCPFDAVGIHRQEIRHGHFLSYILDPRRPHGFGSECLRAFLMAIAHTLSDQAPFRPFDIHSMDLETALVDRHYRHIDILVRIPREKLVLAIELKIDASEGGDQLRRYRETVRTDFKKWNQVFVFLSPLGEAASEEYGEGWEAVSLEPIVRRFEKVTEASLGTQEARMMLRAYTSLLRRNHMTNDRMEQLAQEIWSEHREALDFLVERRPDIRSLVFERRAEIAAELTSKTGFEIIVDHSNRSYVRFAVKSWDEIEGMFDSEGWKPSKRIFLIEIQPRAYNNISICWLQLGEGAASTREAFYNAVKTAGITIGKLTPKYRSLSKIRFQLDEEQDLESQYQAIVKKAASHLSKELPKIDAALETLPRQNSTVTS